MVDWDKPLETCENNPRPVRYIGRVDRLTFPILVAIKNGEEEFVTAVELNGTMTTRGFAIRNVPPKKVKRGGWMFISDGNHPIRMSSSVYATKSLAEDRNPSNHDGFSLVRIEWEETENG